MKIMPDEDLDLELEDNNAVEKRIKSLSEKVKLTAQERDEKDSLLKERDSTIASLNKEKDFYASFSDSTAKYPNASEYKDKIREKVMSGYDVEDATVAVLAKEGKLNYTAPVAPRDNPAGGSAVANIGSGEKSMNEMSKDEKRAALVEALGDRSLNNQ
jgi:hypothetical protein